MVEDKDTSNVDEKIARLEEKIKELEERIEELEKMSNISRGRPRPELERRLWDGKCDHPVVSLFFKKEVTSEEIVEAMLAQMNAEEKAKADKKPLSE
jgi:hypothetical protein